MQNTSNWYRSSYLPSQTYPHFNAKFAEFKRLERDHSKEKQKLTKDKDAGTSCYMCQIQPTKASICLAKGQLTKANQTKTKMENLARELQKVRPKASPFPCSSLIYRTTSVYEQVCPSFIMVAC